MEIFELQNREEEKAWDEYILRSDQSTFYHQIGWKNVIEKTYKHKPVYLIAKEGSGIIGVLPLFLMKSMIFGKKLVSVPFAPYGGVCADNESVKSGLIEAAKRITKKLSVDYLEIRTVSGDGTPGLASSVLYVTSILRLDADSEVLWTNFPKRVRGSIRKAIKSNLKFDMNTTNIRDFYDVHSRNMRVLGSPVHSYNFFINLIREFGDSVNITYAKTDGRVVSSIFILFYKNTLTAYIGGTLEGYRIYNPFYLQFWELIKYGCERGFYFCDFGRSLSVSGGFDFKKRWGAETKELNYQYYLNRIKEVPNYSKVNPSRQKFAKIWAKMPISVVNEFGPILRRNIP